MNPFYIRNLVYGLEDSLISTTGLIVGITFAGLPLNHIIITGIILIIIEATSMSFGSFVSEKSFIINSNEKQTNREIFVYAIIMFLSYLIAGIIILLPYLLKLPYNYVWSILIAIIILFVIILKLEKNIVKSMFITSIGIVILFISILFGKILKI